MVLLSRRVDYSGFWPTWMEFRMFSTWKWTLGNFSTGVRYTMKNRGIVSGEMGAYFTLYRFYRFLSSRFPRVLNQGLLR